MEDNEILDLYFSRSETAIIETDKKYGASLRGLAVRILYNHEDSEECVNDTYLGAWNSIPPKRPDCFFAYLAKICKYSAFGRLDAKNAQKRKGNTVELSAELESCIPDPKTLNEFSDEQLRKLINKFLSGLKKDKRVIFMRRYWFQNSVKEISEGMGISESKVKTTLFRTRAELKSFLEKEGVCV